jgi:hypothetical protein
LAQTTPEPPTHNPIELGSLSLYPGILLRDVGIDDNVFNDHVLPRQDFTYTVIPRVQAHLPVGSARLVGVSTLGFVYFQTYKDQQALNGLAQGWFEVDNSARIRPFASGSLMRSRERTGDDIDTRALRVVTQAKAGLDVRTTAITALTGWVIHDKTSYGDNELFRGVSLPAQLNQTGNTVAGGARIAITPLTSVVVAAEFQQTRFDGTPLRDTNSLRVAPSVTFAPGAVITGAAAAGYREFRPVDSRLPRYRGFAGSADVSFTVMNQARINLSGTRDLSYSYDEREPFYLEAAGRFTVAQHVVGPLELIVLGGRQRHQYQTVGGTSFDGRTETVTTMGGGFGVRLGEQMRFTLTFDHARRKSTGPLGLEYERNRVLGSVDYAL